MVPARIQITCQGCNEQFLVLSSEQGHVAECPNCNGWVDVPELGPSTESRQLDEYVKANSESARLLEESAKLNSQFGLLLDRFEAIIGQWAKIAEKMDRVADRLSGS
jgi:ribosomal protein S27E